MKKIFGKVIMSCSEYDALRSVDRKRCPPTPPLNKEYTPSAECLGCTNLIPTGNRHYGRFGMYETTQICCRKNNKCGKFDFDESLLKPAKEEGGYGNHQ